MAADKKTDRWCILAVDDSQDTLVMIRQVMESRGIEVHVASSGQAALDMLDELHPTAILLDIAMPDMDGYHVLENIRRRSHLDHMPVIAVTSRGMYDDKVTLLEAGFNGYVSKPFRLDKLFDEIRAGINKLNK